jgi:NADH-quinone oxidoreductase subunit G
LPIGVIGAAADLTYKVTHLGEGPGVFAGLANKSHDFAKAFEGAARPMVILGQAAVARPDGAAVLAAAWALAEGLGALQPDWHGFNVLHNAAARVGALDLGFLPGEGGKDFAGMLGGGVDVLWLLGADEFDMSRIGAETFVVYQGHHGDRGAARADVILPGSAYTEKDGTYVNTEGRVQRGFRALFPPGEAREDWRILRAFSAVIGHVLPYDDLATLRERMELINPVFARIGLARFGAGETSGPAGGGPLDEAAFAPAVLDYYLTNPISRASLTMAECSRIAPAALAQHALPVAAE